LTRRAKQEHDGIIAKSHDASAPGRSRHMVRLRRIP